MTMMILNILFENTQKFELPQLLAQQTKQNYLLIYWVLIIIFFTVLYWFLHPYMGEARQPVALVLSGAFAYLPVMLMLGWEMRGQTYNPAQLGVQFEALIPLLPEWGINVSVGLNNISLILILLTALVTPLCVLCCNLGRLSPRAHSTKVTLLFLTQIFLICTFISTNLFFFYVFFEATLIPIFLLIGVWGSGERKLLAAFYFFLYTLTSSFFLLYGIYSYLNIMLQEHGTLMYALEYQNLWARPLSEANQMKLFWFFFLPFMVKLPMMPFHLWLPQAHVEAPTEASVLLAAILLKLGGYGIVRFLLVMFPQACHYYAPYIYVLAILGVIYASLISITQTDMKRIIAYASIAHMNLAVGGFFCFTHQGLEGSMYLMVAHGIVAGALFYCIGLIYDRTGTRSIKQLGGLALPMPLLAFFFLMFTLANMGFPGTSNFVPELLVLTGIAQSNIVTMMCLAIGIVLSAVYSIWLYNRLFFGTLKSGSENTVAYADLQREELAILCLFTIYMLVLGLFSEMLTEWTTIPTLEILLSAAAKG